MDLPNIPSCKTFGEQMTPEQIVLMKCLNNEKLSAADEKTLLEAIEFYKTLFPILKSVNLNIISDQEANVLLDYLDFTSRYVFKFLFSSIFCHAEKAWQCLLFYLTYLFLQRAGKNKWAKFLSHQKEKVWREKHHVLCACFVP